MPKTASMSIAEKFNTLDALKKYYNGNYSLKPTNILAIHESIKDMRDRINHQIFDDYYKVAFVRNPWDWLVSYYSYYKKTDIRKVGVLIDGKYMFGDEAINRIGIPVAEKRNLKDLSFSDFLYIIEQESKAYETSNFLNQIDYPYQPQYKYLVDEKEQIIVDFVGKYERIQSDWAFLCDKLELNSKDLRSLNLPHHNKSNHKDYRSYYDGADIERVYNIYKKDIELFDYDF